MILRLWGSWLGDRSAIARIEQPQIDEAGGETAAFHPGVIAAGSGFRGQNGAQDRGHKPCHGG
jgi:hypothetical protein